MLKSVLSSMQKVNKEVERRKIARGHADYMFESHRDICSKCDGKSFQQIKDPDHICDEGFRLAHIASIAHRQLRGA